MLDQQMLQGHIPHYLPPVSQDRNTHSFLKELYLKVDGHIPPAGYLGPVHGSLLLLAAIGSLHPKGIPALFLILNYFKR